MILIPFSILPPVVLRRISRLFYWLGERLESKFPGMDLYLDQAEFKVSAKEYISMCVTATVSFFVLFSILTSLALLKYNVNIFTGIFIVFIITLFILMQQLMYPKISANKRIKSIERNIIPALQNLSVQLSSGVPLFNALATISESEYGGVSDQFRIAVRRINAGKPQIVVLEDIAKNNPSLHFRRVLWQIINGMKTGSNLSDVIKLSIDNLSEEQLIQIQKYGSQLNPLAMFYMIVAVIIPALGITFVILLSSFMNLPGTATKLIFWGLLAIVFFFQLMFMGLLKTRRPNLLD
jgi:flagellar protein FlaJ